MHKRTKFRANSTLDVTKGPAKRTLIEGAFSHIEPEQTGGAKTDMPAAPEEIDGNFYVYDFACQSIQKTTILGGLIVIEEPLNENAIHIGLAASFSLLTLALTQS